MKNQNTILSSNPEQDTSTETESIWDTLKDETFRGDNAIDEKTPDLKDKNSNPAPSKEDLRQQVLSAYDRAADSKTQSNEHNIKKDNPDVEKTIVLAGPPGIYKKSYNREVDYVLEKLRSGEKVPIPAETRRDSRPSSFEKIKRNLLDTYIGSHLFRSNFKKNALNSYRTVTDAKRIYDKENVEQAKAKRVQRDREMAEQQLKLETDLAHSREEDYKESIKEELLSASYTAKRHTVERHSHLREQEIFERSYNEQLDNIDEIMDIAKVGVEGLSMGTPVEYNGYEIPVIENTGYPLRFLQSNLGYKIHDEMGENGEIKKGKDFFRTEVARRTIENPELWLQNEEHYEKAKKESRQSGEDSISNIMSTSYVNTGYDPSGGVNNSLQNDPYQVTYLFSHIRPGTLNLAISKDGLTGSVDKHDIFSDAQYLNLDDLAKAQKEGDNLERGSYNEVSLYRYNENGEAQPPDALVVHDGNITEYTKRHAAFHQVPIINIIQSS